MSKSLFAVLTSLLVATGAFAQSAPMEFVRDAVGVKTYPAPMRLADRAGIPAAAQLEAASAAAVAEVDAWNADHPVPRKNGFARQLHELVNVDLNATVASKGGPYARGGVVATSDRGIVWSGTFQVDNAYSIRLHLQNVKLPQSATLWVWGDGGQPTGFGTELVDPEGGLWTPSVMGGKVHLEVEVPGSEAASFTVREIMELVAPPTDVRTTDDPTCLIDVQCVPTSQFSLINEFSAASAQLSFVKNGGNYVCSGGLVNDKVSDSTIPYLLTANHCFDTQTSASSLEAFWDYKFASCVSTTIPNRRTGGFPVSNGATLLVSSATSDFTFLRLNSIPAGRTLLGWNADASALQNGTSIYRISHPAPEQYGVLPQQFSVTHVSTTFGQCTGRTRPNYIYSTFSTGEGGVYGGSSGSPSILSNGQIVGQLLGSCGPTPDSGCDSRDATVDGAFSQTYNSIKTYLEGSGQTPQPCVPSNTTACLSNGRFAVSVNWRTPSNGQTGAATAIKYTPDSALFWFFGSDNIEMLLKILNACGLNNRIWVFAAATTDQEYTITVVDTTKGVTKTYFHAAGTPAPAITDTGAFATCP